MKREYSSCGVKILVDADVLLRTIANMNSCGALLIQSINSELTDGIPRKHLSALIGVSTLLEIITDRFYKEIQACLDVDAEELRKGQYMRGSQSPT